VKPLLRYLLIAAGLLAVVLGAVGIFLPILPTTPFLLLAAFLFARSSDRFYRWLHTNRWFGAYLTNYREGRGLPARDKVLTILTLWLAIGLSAGLALSSWWARAGLAAIAVAVTIHLLRIPTYRPQDPVGQAASVRVDSGE
jgi:uncharacterized membrane protein YbaN (DUF454 family)